MADRAVRRGQVDTRDRAGRRAVPAPRGRAPRRRRLRRYVSAGLGFSRADRDANVHRIAYVARLLAKHGVLVFVAAIAPYAATRGELRALSEAAGHPFVEVFVDAPLDIVAARDVKGLYARALAGELPAFTGVSDPYEPPAAPEVAVRTDREPLDVCTAAIAAALRARGLVEDG